MPSNGPEKPYRVYRGGRLKGGVPTATRPPPRTRPDGAAPVRYPGPPPAPRRRRARLRRALPIGLVVVLLLLLAWAVASYLAFRSGVEQANKRLGAAPRAALAEQDGLLVSTPTTILLLGTDGSRRGARAGFRRSDSMMLVRTNPDHNRIAYLSIPRDLRVPIPGYGPNRINTAFQLGGPALAVRTIRGFTGLPVHHLVVVNFSDFRELIDELGGVTVNVPAPILSNRFECPLKTAEQCRSWRGWRFARGPQRMNGRRALIYSRIRENRLDPSESDVTRGERQQQVLQGITSRLLSARTLLRLPFIGDELLRPLRTDLEAGELLQLGWRRWRAPGDRALHCRLGGTPSTVGGASVLVGTEENVSVINMFTGRSAPQPPLPGSGPFGPGCVVGNRQLDER